LPVGLHSGSAAAGRQPAAYDQANSLGERGPQRRLVSLRLPPQSLNTRGLKHLVLSVTGEVRQYDHA
jgi:hypothetical protein